MTRQSAEDLGIVDALAQLSFLIQGTLAHRANVHDVSMIQMRLLGILRDREPTMQELARLLGLDKSSTTGLVDRAEKRGLVQRVPALDDRRATHVRLTTPGRRMVTAVVKAFQRDVTILTGSLTAAETTALSTLATKVVAAQDASTRPEVTIKT